MLASDFFTLPESEIFDSFDPGMAPWQWIPLIQSALATIEKPPRTIRQKPPHLHIGEKVWIHPSVKLPPYGSIEGPAWIDEHCELRPGVFIRANVIAGPGCVLGNSCEFKNCLLGAEVQVPHFNYVGDSVLGNRAHLGAGAVLANLRLDRGPVTVRLPSGAVDTGLSKLGALLGDGAETGCNAVLQPGTILGKRSVVLPAVAFGGVLPPATIARVRESFTTLPRKN